MEDNPDDRREELDVRLEQIISRADSLTEQGQSDSSLQYYLWAYHLADSIGSASQVAHVADLLGNHYLHRKGNTGRAQEFLTLERDILEHTDDAVEQLIRNYLNLSIVRVRKLDLSYAESYAMMALDLATTHGLTDSILWVDIYCGIGNVHYHMLRFHDAVAAYRTALEFLPNTSEGKAGWNRIALGFAYIYINRRDTSYCDADSALYWLEEFHRRNINDTSALADFEYVSGIGHYLNGQYAESIYHFQKATEFYRLVPNPNPYNQPDAFHVLSAAYQFDHRYDEALQAIDSALIRVFGFDYGFDHLKQDIRSILFNSLKAEILADIGISSNTIQPVLEAVQIYQDLDSLITYFVKHDTESYLHHQFYNNFYYYKRIQICAFGYSYSHEAKWLHGMHDAITAYKTQSFLRDRILNDLFHSDARRYASVRKYVANDITLENAYFRSRNFSQHADLSSYREINELLRKREKIIQQMREEAPHILNLWTHIDNISAQALMKYTKDYQTPVINFYIGNPFYNKEHIYVLSAYEGEFQFELLENAPQVIQRVDSLYLIHDKYTVSGQNLDTQWYFRTSHFLYENLVHSVVHSMSGAQDIVIIPDHALHRLAFDALVTNEFDNVDSTFSPEYLIEQKNIIYSFSPNSLFNVSRFPHERMDILAMGFSDNQTISDDDNEVPELLGSITELQIISEYAGSGKARLFSGSECTKQNFFRHAENAAYIHLSTHGTFDATNRHSSRIYMRGPEGIDYLYQHELRYMDISPDLLVLSACDSGAGMLSNEEGMFSIGRAFLAAGTQRVISALWPLSDRASKILFTHFYSQLFSGSHPASALRDAKLAAIHQSDQFSFPAYWGALILHQ